MDYLKETRMLDFNNSAVQSLLISRKWLQLSEKERIGAIYDFVRDEILFGYNEDDELTSSQILKDGFGQCNTKGILLMSLLRASGIKCRFHGFEIDKALQKGAISGLWYLLSPSSIVHSWVEVEHNERWYNLEGFILDSHYLVSLQKKFPGQTEFCGYGAATKDLQRPNIYWNANDTYIQKEGINMDFGVYANPDEFFKEHKQKLGRLKKLVFKVFSRHSFNRNVSRIRHLTKFST